MFKPGQGRLGGRAKGTPNKSTVELRERIASLGCDPFEFMALIATNKLPCGVCRGSGKTPYRTPKGQIAKRVCESCYGSLLEKCDPDLRLTAARELAQYLEPKRKAVEHTGTVQHVKQYDLSKLSDAELQAMKELAEKATPPPPTVQ
jgi:hypothetical protein